jgi:hypothetical protein
MATPQPRQVLYPPFGVGQIYKIFTANHPNIPSIQAYYVEPDDEISTDHYFREVSSGNLTLIRIGPDYGNYGKYVALSTNSGGRHRKSKRSKRSKRSNRKSRRRY